MEGNKQSWLLGIYDRKYKQLLVIPFVILFIALSLIFYKYATTGEFLNKDISLKGGIILTLPLKDSRLVPQQLEDSLQGKYLGNDISVRSLKNLGVQEGFIIEADIDSADKGQLDSFLADVESLIGAKLGDVHYGIETVGSSLGQNFFRESLKMLFFAFLFMGIVVFIYFRTFIPSIAIILAAFSDMAVALAVINLMGIKIGTAGIAGFLMLIGYSIDTDILLTVRVLKRKEGTIMDRVYSSIKTGMTETITAIVAVTVAMLVTQSEVIKQIMLILLIGLAADIIFTWIQNVSLLRIYLERRDRKAQQ
ncbi:protein translocase subunit SecF [Candidatus Woesearchaeota archaeon]|nr:protein translocase subunit SecF [Candidatus Woesearchaeota archaeon]